MLFFKPRYKYGLITKKWGDAKLKKEFDNKIDKWINQFNKNEKPLLIELLNKYTYYSEETIKQKVEELHNNFLKIHGEDISNVTFAKIPKEYGTANSDLFFCNYWLINEIKDFCTNNIITEFLEYDSIPEVLAIVDDFVGSGDTVIESLKKMFIITPELQNSTIYILTVHITQVGKKAIIDFGSKLGINITVVYLDITDKTFKNNIVFPENELVHKKNAYVELCNNKGVGKNIVFGYKDVESLVSFQYSTPNNTLGIFWHNSDSYLSLFCGRIINKKNSIKELKKTANQNKHIQQILFSIDDNSYNKFIVYCIMHGENFLISKACNDFGIDEELLMKRLDYIERKNYIKIINGKIIPTNEIDLKLVKKRLKGWDLAERTLMEAQLIPLKEVSYIPLDFSKSFSGYK